eukprot:EG_transcript_1835
MLTLISWLSLLLVATCDERPVEIVLARCRENVDWIDDAGYGGITTVYDKCGVTSGPGHHIERPNVGREGGTFLQHIVDNYDELADWTVFSQAEKPTYGYRGHRLGGGHMMSNVQFKDYVEAGRTRQENPRFFVFTTAMLSEGDQAFQNIRRGYGDDYVQLDAEKTFQQKMCGAVADWHQWYMFPQWFTSMVEQLQEEQMAPLSRFDVAKVFSLWGVQPTEGVTFFAQGARFAASREAIQARPKAYYAGLLEYMNHRDPWAGYYMEWLWYYILGGSDAPCGFEEHVANSLLAWKSGKGRQDLMKAQADSGVSGSPIINITVIDTSIEVQLKNQGGSGTAQFSNADHTITVPQVITTLSLLFNNANLVFQSTLTYNVPTGDITGQSLSLLDASTITANSVTLTALGVFQTCVINAPLSISAGGVGLGNAGDPQNPTPGILTIASTASFVNAQIVGQGTLRCQSRGKQVIFRLVVMVVTITLDLTFTGVVPARRTDLTSPSLSVTTFCGTAAGTVNLGSTNVLVLDLTCTASSQSSNTVSTLTGSGGLLYLSGVSSSSKPTVISTWTGVASTPIEIDNVAAGSYCVTVLVYGASSCASSWSVTFDSCPSGTCTLIGGVYSGDNSKCQAQFCQSGAGGSNAGGSNAGGSSAGGGDSGSNGGLYGLIALVAIVPLAGLIAFGVWYYYGSQEAAPAVAYQYPQPQHAAYPTYPTAHPQQYPAAYPQAYYPQGVAYMEGYPLQQTPMPTPMGGFGRL